MNKLLPKGDLHTGRIAAQLPPLFMERSGAGAQQGNLLCSTWDREDISPSVLLQHQGLSVRISWDFLSERSLTSSPFLFLYRSGVARKEVRHHKLLPCRAQALVLPALHTVTLKSRGLLAGLCLAVLFLKAGCRIPQQIQEGQRAACRVSCSWDGRLLPSSPHLCVCDTQNSLYSTCPLRHRTQRLK